jgi:hypothetical protein
MNITGRRWVADLEAHLGETLGGRKQGALQDRRAD